MGIKESALSVIASLTDSDFIRAVTAAGESRKIQATGVGKYAVETYSGSTLAGSAQSVQSAVGGLKNDITTMQGDIATLNTNLINKLKQSLIVGTASGSIASFNNGSDIFPALKCVAKIEPNQDLHGYDKPWVGGAGKNKLNASSGSGTVSDVTFTNTNGVIVASGNASANVYRQVGTFTPENGVEYILSGCPSGGASGKYRITLSGYGYDYGNGYTFTGDGQSHNITCDVYSGYPTSGTTLTFKPMIRLSSESDASWTPYENICPISGSTEVKTTAYGKNLLRNSSTMDGWWKASGATISGGVATLTGSTSNWNGAFGTPKLDSKLLDGTTNYVLSFDYKCTASCSLNIPVAGSSENVDSASFIRTRYTDWQSPQPTLSSTNGEWQRFSLNARTIDVSQFNYGSGDVNSWNVQIYARSNVTLQVRNVQIEVGNSATAYEASNVNTYTTALGRTVYKGTLDVVSGLLTVTHKLVDLGDYTWVFNNQSGHYYYLFNVADNDMKAPPDNNTKANAICSAYKNDTYTHIYNNTTNGTFAIGNGKRLAIYDTYAISQSMTADQFKTYVTGQKVCYELATPTTYQLTPQQVDILLGDNNIFANTGPMDPVEYYADATITIQNLS